MKTAYPILLTPASRGFTVYVPDLEINTEGASIPDAIEMASDAISLWGVARQDMGQPVPPPSSVLPSCQADQIAAYALVDFDAYRRANDLRPVRKNVTLPSWLCYQAEAAHLNFSQVLQAALKRELHL